MPLIAADKHSGPPGPTDKGAIMRRCRHIVAITQRGVACIVVTRKGLRSTGRMGDRRRSYLERDSDGTEAPITNRWSPTPKARLSSSL